MKFEKLTVDISRDELRDVLESLGKEFKWGVRIDTGDIFIADSTRYFSADNRITILVAGQDIYVNARSDGDKISLFRQSKLTESIIAAIRMRHHELQHQKSKQHRVPSA